jgi:hypothetical protein
MPRYSLCYSGVGIPEEMLLSLFSFLSFFLFYEVFKCCFVGRQCDRPNLVDDAILCHLLSYRQMGGSCCRGLLGSTLSWTV